MPAPLLNLQDNSQAVGGFTATELFVPVITAGAYTSGFTLGSLAAFPNAVRLPGGSGVIQSITITDKAKAANGFDVIFFTVNPSNTTFTDHGALTISNIDLLTAQWVSVPASAYTTLATSSIATVANIGLPFKLPTGTTLFMALVVRGTTTYSTTGDISVTVGIFQD